MSDQVLVIDDEEPIVASIIATLDDAGIRARGESNPHAAMENFRADPTDVVIVDYRLSSGVTGVDIIAQIQPIKPYTQFILVSGYINQDLNEETLTDQLRKTLLANQYIQKPFDPDRLIAAVRDALQLMPDISTDWKSIAQQYTERGLIDPDHVRAVNEKIKEHLIEAVDEARGEDVSNRENTLREIDPQSGDQKA